MCGLFFIAKSCYYSYTKNIGSFLGDAPVSTAKSNLMLQVRLLLTSNQLKQITEDDSFVEDEQFALAA